MLDKLPLGDLGLILSRQSVSQFGICQRTQASRGGCMGV